MRKHLVRSGWFSFFFLSFISFYRFPDVCVQASNPIRVLFFSIFDCLIFSSTLVAINHSRTWIWLFCRAIRKILFVCGLSWVSLCVFFLHFLTITFFLFLLFPLFFVHSPNSSIRIVTVCNGVTIRIWKLLNASCVNCNIMEDSISLNECSVCLCFWFSLFIFSRIDFFCSLSLSQEIVFSNISLYSFRFGSVLIVSLSRIFIHGFIVYTELSIRTMYLERWTPEYNSLFFIPFDQNLSFNLLFVRYIKFRNELWISHITVFQTLWISVFAQSCLLFRHQATIFISIVQTHLGHLVKKTTRERERKNQTTETEYSPIKRANWTGNQKKATLTG